MIEVVTALVQSSLGEVLLVIILALLVVTVLGVLVRRA